MTKNYLFTTNNRSCTVLLCSNHHHQHLYGLHDQKILICLHLVTICSLFFCSRLQLQFSYLIGRFPPLIPVLRQLPIQPDYLHRIQIRNLLDLSLWIRHCCRIGGVFVCRIDTESRIIWLTDRHSDYTVVLCFVVVTHQICLLVVSVNHKTIVDSLNLN